MTKISNFFLRIFPWFILLIVFSLGFIFLTIDGSLPSVVVIFFFVIFLIPVILFIINVRDSYKRREDEILTKEKFFLFSFI